MGSSSNPSEGVPSFESCQMNDVKYSKMRLESIISSLREERLISLFVEPTSHCDLACQFCAMHSTIVNLDDNQDGKFARKGKSRMSYEHFCILVEKLLSLPRLKMLQFSGHGEPLLNKSLPSMIALAKKKAIAEQIVVTTNGTVDMIKDAGIDWANIYAAAPIRGSRLYDICVEKGFITDDSDILSANIYQANIRTCEMDPEELTHYVYHVNLDVNFINNHRLLNGDYDIAIGYFENVVNNHPDHAFAHYALSQAYRLKGGFDEQAVVHRRRFKEIINSDADWAARSREFNLD